MPELENEREQDELCLYLFSLLERPNRADLPESASPPTTRARNAGLAEELDYSEGQISKLLNKERNWSDESLNRALAFIKRKMKVSVTAVARDLLLDTAIRTQRLFSDTELEHEVMVRLVKTLPDMQETVPAKLLTKDHLRLIGYWGSVFLCIDPKHRHITRHAVAVVGFEIYKHSEHELAIKETNYEFEESKNVVPEGRVRLNPNDRILEFDIIYLNGVDPRAKYLGYLPPSDPHGRIAFIATLLDLKLKSRLVVSRPTTFIKLKKPVLEFETHPEGSDIYKAVSVFMTNHAQFSGTSFELCPTREPPWQDWVPIFEAVEAAVGPVACPD